ncbi:MAG TPA: hypothetical protein VLF62_04925, partial [Candidatus Saccharimonadales bacterium]|nr:hypothetical protein [Candidatus Saccharimonadales bacterium]
ILRTDGTSVALKTYVDQDGGMINIALLNDQYAVEEAAHRTAAIEKNHAVSALAHHLKVDEEEMAAFKEKAGEMDTPDLQAMLKELQTSEVATGDEEFDQQLNSSAHRFSMQVTYTDGAIRKARKRYAKAAMPASGLLDDFMKKRVATRAMEYGKLVETNLQALEYNEDHVEQELAKEQALRHAELNKRLRRRKIISAAGVTALTGVVDAISIAVPTGMGYLGELHLNTTSGAILGSAVALGVTIRQFFVSRKQLRSAARFSQESTTDPHAPLPEQLSAEIEQGGYNAHIVRNIST